MADSIEVPGGSHDEAIDRFAQLWWGEARGSADAESTASSTEPSRVVIRAERV